MQFKDLKIGQYFVWKIDPEANHPRVKISESIYLLLDTPDNQGFIASWDTKEEVIPVTLVSTDWRK